MTPFLRHKITNSPRFLMDIQEVVLVGVKESSFCKYSAIFLDLVWISPSIVVLEQLCHHPITDTADLDNVSHFLTGTIRILVSRSL